MSTRALADRRRIIAEGGVRDARSPPACTAAVSSAGQRLLHGAYVLAAPLRSRFFLVLISFVLLRACSGRQAHAAFEKRSSL